MMRRLLLILALSATGTQALALGLGELDVKSGLDEPLNAELELQSTAPEELDKIEVRAATRDDYERAGRERPAFVNTLEFNVETRPDGAPFIRITSTEPIKEPFMHLLVSVQAPGRKMVREYTALIDPPLYATPASPPVDSAVVADTAPAPAASAGPEASGASRPDRGLEYGPTQPGDTLWEIAAQLDTGGLDANIFQVMMAVFRQNPDAFSNNNINFLRTGSLLRLADLSSVARISKQEAQVTYRAHLEEWQNGRTRLADAGEVTQPAPDGAAVTRGDGMQVDTGAAGSGGGAGENVTSAPLVDTEREAGSDDNLASTQPEKPAATEQGSGVGENISEAPPAPVSAGGQDEDVAEVAGAPGGEENPEAEASVASEVDLPSLRGTIGTLESQIAALEGSDDDLSSLREAVDTLKNRIERLEGSTGLGAAAPEGGGGQFEAAGDDISTAGADPETTVAKVNPTSEPSPASESGPASPVSESSPVSAESSATSIGASSASTEGATPVRVEAGSPQAPSNADSAGTSWIQTSQWIQWPRQLLGNRLWPAVIGLAAVVLLFGAMLVMRRRRPKQVYDDRKLMRRSNVDDGLYDTTPSFPNVSEWRGSDKIQVEEGDLMAEAAEAIADGRDLYAERVLKEAANRYPDRKDLKILLLELYRKRDDMESCRVLYEELYRKSDWDGSEIPFDVTMAELAGKVHPEDVSYAPEQESVPEREPGPDLEEDDFDLGPEVNSALRESSFPEEKQGSQASRSSEERTGLRLVQESLEEELGQLESDGEKTESEPRPREQYADTGQELLLASEEATVLRDQVAKLQEMLASQELESRRLHERLELLESEVRTREGRPGTKDETVGLGEQDHTTTSRTTRGGG